MKRFRWKPKAAVAIFAAAALALASPLAVSATELEDPATSEAIVEETVVEEVTETGVVSEPEAPAAPAEVIPEPVSEPPAPEPELTVVEEPAAPEQPAQEQSVSDVQPQESVSTPEATSPVDEEPSWYPNANVSYWSVCGGNSYPTSWVWINHADGEEIRNIVVNDVELDPAETFYELFFDPGEYRYAYDVLNLATGEVVSFDLHFGVPECGDGSPEPIEVTPEAPGQDGNEVTIPSQEGVTYLDQDGNVLEPGGTVVLEEGETLVVVANPEDGYVFPEDAATEWEFEYVDDSSPVEPWDPESSFLVYAEHCALEGEEAELTQHLWPADGEEIRNVTIDGRPAEDVTSLLPGDYEYSYEIVNLETDEVVSVFGDLTIYACDSEPGEPEPTEVTPEEPARDGNEATIPSQECVTYVDQDGNILEPGTVVVVEEGKTLIITAIPTEDCVFPEDAVTEWEFEYEEPSQPTEPEEPVDPTDPGEDDGSNGNEDGGSDAGDGAGDDTGDDRLPNTGQELSIALIALAIAFTAGAGILLSVRQQSATT